MQDVPPYITAAGEPLKYAGLNAVGLKRRGFSKEAMNLLRRAYRLIYRSRLSTRHALQIIRDTVEPIPEVLAVVDFIEKSHRGII